MSSHTRILVAVLAGLICLGGGAARAEGGRLLVFAAASTTNVITDAGRAFAKQSGIKVVNSFAASSTLAKQINNGAPADVYISANVKWMDYLQKQDGIEPSSRFDLARNRLVLIAPAGEGPKPLKIGPGLDLAALLGDGRLSVGNPAHVPAGIYAKQALTHLGLWSRVRDRLAITATVRAALALVETGEAPLGVVYATDAAISPKVRVLGVFPKDSHAPILYPVAVVKGRDTPAARSFMKFLRSPQVAKLLAKYGFLPVAGR